MSAARRRFTTCKCCGGLSGGSAFCAPCGAHQVQRSAVAHAVVRALWGSDGAARFETELRARRLFARRTAKPGRKAS
jgi:hypothetical protein